MPAANKQETKQKTKVEAALVPNALAPLDTKAFDFMHAQHLLRRTCFGADKACVDQAVAQGLEKTIASLLQQTQSREGFEAPELDPDIKRPLTQEERARLQDANRNGDESVRSEFRARRNAANRTDRDMNHNLQRWWAKRMSQGRQPFLENMTLLWHNHFATRHRDVQDAYLMWKQNDFFRMHSLDFGALARGIVRDPAMLRFLNNDKNNKKRPNENLARELMELFTVGADNYSEDTIKEGARALTGNTVHDNDFRFHERNHDTGEKNLFGEVDNHDADSFVELLLARSDCAEYIAMKLFRHFVADVEPYVSSLSDAQREVVLAMAQMIRADDYKLSRTLQALFKSQYFYAQGMQAQMIKSPVVLLAGTVRSLGLPHRLPDPKLKRQAVDQARALSVMGQELFGPPSVAGWDCGTAWISTGALFHRQNVAMWLLTGTVPKQTHDAKRVRWDALALLPKGAASSADEAADHVAMLLLPQSAIPIYRAQLVAYMQAQAKVNQESVLGLVLLVASLPAYQLY